jgi:hypothetical protein
MCKKGLFFIVFSVLAFSVFGRGEAQLKPRPFFYNKEINSGGTITITKYTGFRKKIRIPENFNIKRPKNTPPPSVTAIGEDAFVFKRLTRIILPSRVTTIENWAFSNNELTNVAVPNAVATIGEGAFAFNQLETITLPNSGSFVIGDLAFYNNKLTRIAAGTTAGTAGGSTSGSTGRQAANAPGTAPRNIIGNTAGNSTSSIVIGNYAFADNLLTEITLGNAVSSIGDWAFYNNKLENVTIGNNVSSIGEGAFAANDLSSVVIPNSVASVGNYAFASNVRLKEITIGRAVSSIGDWAFDYDFVAGYYRNGRQAGTYTYDETTGSWNLTAKK